MAGAVNAIRHAVELKGIILVFSLKGECEILLTRRSIAAYPMVAVLDLIQPGAIRLHRHCGKFLLFEAYAGCRKSLPLLDLVHVRLTTGRINVFLLIVLMPVKDGADVVLKQRLLTKHPHPSYPLRTYYVRPQIWR